MQFDQFETIGPYLAVLVAIWIASIGVPVPEDIALLGGGLACYFGKANVYAMIPVGMFAVLSGDLFVFYLGRRWASTLLEHRLTRRLATPERVEALRRQFLNHQLKTVFLGRFMPGMRALIFLTAGAMRMKLWKFLVTNGTAALLSVPLFILLGYLFGHSYEKLEKRLADIEHVIVLAAIVVAIGWMLWYSFSRSAKAKAAKKLLEANNKAASESN